MARLLALYRIYNLVATIVSALYEAGKSEVVQEVYDLLKQIASAAFARDLDRVTELVGELLALVQRHLPTSVIFADDLLAYAGARASDSAVKRSVVELAASRSAPGDNEVVFAAVPVSTGLLKLGELVDDFAAAHGPLA